MHKSARVRELIARVAHKVNAINRFARPYGLAMIEYEIQSGESASEIIDIEIIRLG
jgi:hypothetical protein